MSSEAQVDPIPSPIRELLRVYEQELHAVEFPGVSTAGLQVQVEAVVQTTLDLERALATLRESRTALELATAELLKGAERGLAYARVYAGDDDKLSKLLAGIELAPSSDSKPRRRRKPATTTAKSAATPDASKPQLALDQVSRPEPTSIVAA